MKINFLIPTTGLTGGIKVIFEQANGLARLGHEVNLVYPYVLNKNAGTLEKIVGLIKIWRRWILKLIGKDKIDWFNLDTRIKVVRVFNLSEKHVPVADVNIATANQTADWLVDYNNSNKFYYIQDYETWTRDVKLVDATWTMPLKKIVISSWLKKIAEEKFGESVVAVIPDGVDIKVFYNHSKLRQLVDGEVRNILLMYHELEKKGFKDGLKAFGIAKTKFPELKLKIFGAYKPRVGEIPAGIEFFYQPTPTKLRELYSEADVFLWPSRVEGFGLPPMEAMACACAVISTDTGAIRDYAINDETVIIVPPNEPEIMVNKLIELIENRDMIKRLSLAGAEKIAEFSWERASKQLEEVLLKESRV